MALPCEHRPEVVGQVSPTIELLKNMDAHHPAVLREHAINPDDYHGGLVFRSAVESIRGSYIASGVSDRQAMVADVLESMKKRGSIVEFQAMGTKERFDFTVVLTQDPDRFAAVEVKGGEGNSINISVRPRWAREFVIWSHLDGAVVNEPAHAAHAIVCTRLSAEMVLRGKHVDALIIKDRLCGTRARPCPKYPGHEATVGLYGAPCLFLFPSEVPTWDGDRAPAVHNMENLELPFLVLEAFGVAEREFEEHLYEVQITLFQAKSGSIRRRTEVYHKGELRDAGRGKGSS